MTSSRLLMSIAGEKYKSTVEKLKIIRENLKSADESKLIWKKSKISLYIFLILMGLNLMYIQQKFIEENLKLTNSNDLLLYEKRAYKNCQSCARYFSPMLLHGKEKDGTVNKGFCSECYNDGEFLNTELIEQYVIDEIKKANPKMKKVEKKVSELIRWNKNPYVDNYKF